MMKIIQLTENQREKARKDFEIFISQPNFFAEKNFDDNNIITYLIEVKSK